MSFETLAKSMATMMIASGLAAAPAVDAAAPGAAPEKTPEQLEADEAALAKSLADAAPIAGAPAAKTITLTLDDGTEVDAFDGAEMLKALGDRLDTSDTAVKQLLGQAVMLIGAQGQQLAEMTKSLTEAGALVKTQGETITALRTDFDALRNEPSGRKSVSAPPAGGQMAKSLQNGDEDEAGMQPREFLAKCLGLQKDGRMSLQEVAMAEAAIGSGLAVPDGIRNKVFSTK